METLKIDFEKHLKVHWTDTEKANALLAIEFVQNLMNDHNFAHIRKRFGAQSYKQHNQSMTDGIGGVLKTVEDLVKRYPTYTYDVKHIDVDQNRVTFHSHVTLKSAHRGNPKKGLNIMDIWRIENHEIVEHWDAVQPIDFSMRLFGLLTGGKFRNANTFF